MQKSATSIRFRLISISLVIVLIPMLLFSMLCYRFVYASYVSTQKEVGNLILNQAKNKVEDLMSSAKISVDLIRSNVKIQEIMLHSAETPYARADQLDDMLELMYLLTNYEFGGNITKAKIIYENDCEYASINKVTTLKRKEFLEIAQANGLSLTNNFLNGYHWLCTDFSKAGLAESGQYVALVCMMRDMTRYERMLGYILVLQDRALYASAMREVLTQDTSSAFRLMDASGNCIADTGSSAIYADQHVLQMRIPIQNTQWELELLMPLDEFTRKVNILTCNIAIVTLVLAASAVTISDKLYRKSIVRRIENIINTMDLIRNQDNMRVRFPITRQDELGQIEQHFNLLIEKIQIVRQKECDMVEYEKRQRVQLMNAQINPHFLYNTLNAIYWIAQDEDYPTIQKMIKSLASFYKTGFNPQSEMGSIQNEVKHIKEYIYLINISKKHHIQLNTEVSDQVCDMLIPHFILQPIVENSIIHGFGKRDYGSIIVRIFQRNDFLYIIVEDDGIGLSDAQRIITTDAQNGFGLGNIQKYLSLYYGGNASLSIENSVSHQGCIVTLIFPLT